IVNKGATALASPTGPAAPFIGAAANAAFWAGMSRGALHTELRDIADDTPLDVLRKSSKFEKLYQDNGQNEKAARDQLYNLMQNQTADYLAMAGGALGGGLFGAVRGKLPINAAKTAARRFATGALEVGGGIGAQAGTTEYGRQVGEIQGGI